MPGFRGAIGRNGDGKVRNHDGESKSCYEVLRHKSPQNASVTILCDNGCPVIRTVGSGIGYLTILPHKQRCGMIWGVYLN